MITKHMNHTEYPESLKNKTIQQLHFIARDAKAAIDANPLNDNNGYYADEINYCCNEMHMRQKR